MKDAPREPVEEAPAANGNGEAKTIESPPPAAHDDLDTAE